jgi:hypothetical protein
MVVRKLVYNYHNFKYVFNTHYISQNNSTVIVFYRL